MSPPSRCSVLPHSHRVSNRSESLPSNHRRIVSQEHSMTSSGPSTQTLPTHTPLQAAMAMSWPAHDQFRALATAPLQRNTNSQPPLHHGQQPHVTTTASRLLPLHNRNGSTAKQWPSRPLSKVSVSIHREGEAWVILMRRQVLHICPGTQRRVQQTTTTTTRLSFCHSFYGLSSSFLAPRISCNENPVLNCTLSLSLLLMTITPFNTEYML